MNTKLRANEPCPLHRNSRTCACHGEQAVKLPKEKKPLRRGPVYRVEDPHHPRGYREICSQGELRRRKNRLIQEGYACAACSEPFKLYAEIELAHKSGKGMGAGKRDDHWENLCLMHKIENREQGSRSLEQYLADKLAEAAKQLQLVKTSALPQGSVRNGEQCAEQHPGCIGDSQANRANNGRGDR